MAGSDLFTLDGKIAAVIGAGSGIGEAVAIGAARAGAVVACVDAHETAAAATAAKIGARGSALPVDIGHAAAVRSALEGLASAHRALDIVVCTPSINVRKPILGYSEEELDRVIQLNLKGTFNVVQAAGRIMTAQRRGSIVLFSSIRSQVVEPGQSVYAMT